MAEEFVSSPVSVDVVATGSGAISEPTLNTSALKAAAHAFLNKGTTNPASSEQPITSHGQPVSPVQQIPVTVTPAAQKPAAPSLEQAPAEGGQKITGTDPNTGQKVEFDLLSIPDDAIVKTKRNGEIVTISGKEAKEEGMRASKFTFEMQKLRRHEEELSGRLKQAETLERLVTDDVALAEYLYTQKPHIVETLAAHMGMTKAEAAQALAQQVQSDAGVQPQTPSGFRIENPAEIASLGEVDQLFQQRSTTLEQQVLAQVKSQLGEVTGSVQEQVRSLVQDAVRGEIRQLQSAHEVAAIDGEIKSTVSGILEANPALKAIPKVEQLIRFEVFQMGPKSKAELIEAVNHVAQGIVEGLDETYKTARKVSVIDKATMERTGIEPPVGTQPTFTRPIDYRDSNGKVSFAKIREAAKASIGS